MIHLRVDIDVHPLGVVYWDEFIEYPFLGLHSFLCAHQATLPVNETLAGKCAGSQKDSGPYSAMEIFMQTEQMKPTLLCDIEYNL